MKINLKRGLGAALAAALVFTIAPFIPLAPFQAQTAHADPASITSVIVDKQGSADVDENSSVTLVAAVQGGSGTYVSYEWSHSSDGGTYWNTCGGSTYDNTYTTTANETQNGMLFKCKVTDSDGEWKESDSPYFKLAAYASLIQTQPADQKVVAGEPMTFTISTMSVGTIPYHFKWQKLNKANGVWDTVSTDQNYSITPDYSMTDSIYRCVVTDSRTVPAERIQISKEVTLTVVPALTITQPPATYIAVEGDNVTFGFTASGGESPVTFKWQTDLGTGGVTWTDVPGGTERQLTLSSVGTGMNNYRYKCLVNDAFGQHEETSEVTLTVLPKLKIDSHPVDKTVQENQTATFSVTASGGGGQPPYTYEWQVKKSPSGSWADVSDGTGGDTNTYTTPAATSDMDGYQYRCIVKDTHATKQQTETSGVATLYVQYTARFITTALPDGEAEHAYSFQIKAGGNPAPTFSASGNMPAGLTIGSDGKLSGTVNIPGTYTFTVVATNEVNGVTKVVTQGFDLVIKKTTHTVYTFANPTTGGKPIADWKNAYEGELITLEANPYAGYSFTGWEFSGVSATTTLEKVTFRMPNNNVSATAKYTPVTLGSSYSGSSYSITSPFIAYYYSSLFDGSSSNSASSVTTPTTGTASSTRLSSSATALKNTKVYALQSTKSKTLGTIKKGGKFALLKMGDTYATISYNGQTGYVLASDVNAGFNYTVRVAAKQKVTIYTAMNTNKKNIYSTLAAGANINIAGRNGKWLIIIGANNQKLYTLASGVRF